MLHAGLSPARRGDYGGRIGAAVLMLPDRLLFHSVHLEETEALVFMGHDGETVFVLVREDGQWLIDDIL